MLTLRTVVIGTLALVTGTAADGFWLAKNSLHGIGGHFDPKGWLYIFVDDIKNCGQISHAPLLNGHSDVSKGQGIRVKWKDQGDKIEKLVPLEVEWNTGKSHATWYADKAGAVVDVQGKQLFKCKADTTQKKSCRLPAAGTADVISILHCDGPKPAQ